MSAINPDLNNPNERELAIEKAKKIQPGQTLYFDQSPGGRNLAKMYGEPMRFFKYVKGPNQCENNEFPTIRAKDNSGQEINFTFSTTNLVI